MTCWRHDDSSSAANKDWELAEVGGHSELDPPWGMGFRQAMVKGAPPPDEGVDSRPSNAMTIMTEAASRWDQPQSGDTTPMASREVSQMAESGDPRHVEFSQALDANVGESPQDAPRPSRHIHRKGTAFVKAAPPSEETQAAGPATEQRPSVDPYADLYGDSGRPSYGAEGIAPTFTQPPWRPSEPSDQQPAPPAGRSGVASSSSAGHGGATAASQTYGRIFPSMQAAGCSQEEEVCPMESRSRGKAGKSSSPGRQQQPSPSRARSGTPSPLSEAGSLAGSSLASPSRGPPGSFQASLIILNLNLEVLAAIGPGFTSKLNETIEAAVAAHVGDADRSRAKYRVNAKMGPPFEGAQKTVGINVGLYDVRSASTARMIALKLEPPPPRLCDAIAKRLQQVEGMRQACCQGRVLRVLPWIAQSPPPSPSGQRQADRMPSPQPPLAAAPGQWQDLDRLRARGPQAYQQDNSGGPRGYPQDYGGGPPLYSQEMSGVAPIRPAPTAQRQEAEQDEDCKPM